MKFLISFLLIIYWSVGMANVKIGFLANRGKETVTNRSKKLGIFLTQELNQQVDIIPLNFAEMDAAIDSRQVDFVFLNPMMFVQYEYKYDIRKILKIKRFLNNQFLGSFGSVVFSKQALNIKQNKLNKLKVAAVSPNSLGGWLIAKNHFLKHGIYLTQDHVDFFYNHYTVVNKVLQGKYDLGIVRTGILEELIKQGKVTPDQFKIHCPHNSKEFTYLSSDTYSEWPLAVLPHVSEKLSLSLANALLKVSYISPELTVDLVGLWTLPTNYHRVKELMQEFHYYPYDLLTRMSFRKVVRENPRRFIFMITLLLSFVTVSFLFMRKNRYVVNLTKALSREKEELNQFLDIIPMPLVLLDEHQKIYHVNKIFSQLVLGNPRGTLLKQYIKGINCKQFITSIVQQENFTLGEELYLETSEQELIPVSLEVVTRNIEGYKRTVVIIHDLRQQKQVVELQKAMHLKEYEAQKIRSVGILGSGIAHEINNPLTIINSSAKILLKYLAKEKFDQKVWQKMLDDTISAAGKIAAIIKALRLLGKSEEESPCEMTSVGKLIESCLLLVSTRFLQQRINLKYDYKFTDKKVYISHAKFHQIVINILMNAESVVQQCEKERWIKLETELVDEYFILFKISNSGERISKKMETDAFVPFASDSIEVTGKGSSLAAAKTYLQSIKGDIWVNANSDYTEFVIRLPLDFRSIKL